MACSSSNQRKMVTEVPGNMRLYDDGTVERLRDTDFIPPSINNAGPDGVSTKDVVFLEEPNLSARIYLPNYQPSSGGRKLPLILYFHGGGFCVSSPFCGTYSHYATRMAGEAQAMVVSFDYRKAPEHLIPAAYEDSRAGLRWVASHWAGNGPESWLNDHADFDQVFLAGDSSGGNIAHNLAMSAGDPEFGLDQVGISGLALVQPHFWGSNPIGSELDFPRPEARVVMDTLWPFICPSSPDNDDPRINPLSPSGPGLVGLRCRSALVCVAGSDLLKDRGWKYYEALGQSGWKGVVEVFETEGEGHGFHLYNPESEKAGTLIKRLAAFFNKATPPLVKNPYP